MQAAISNAVADDLMAIKAHLSMPPSHIPGNLVAAVSWHAIGELYHICWLPLYLWIWVLNPAFQRNVLCWEQVDPPWELPDYISDLVQALQDTQVWIASSGVVEQVVVAPLPTLPQPTAPSDGESKIVVSDAELPSPLQVIPKVCQADDIEHTLNKGL